MFVVTEGMGHSQYMKIVAMQFKGDCACCGHYSERARGAVEVEISNGSQEWICLRCARKLAARLQKAAELCRQKIRKGLEFRFDRWQAKSKKAR
jgi:hypothetical protein